MTAQRARRPPSHRITSTTVFRHAAELSAEEADDLARVFGKNSELRAERSS